MPNLLNVAFGSSTPVGGSPGPRCRHERPRNLNLPGAHLLSTIRDNSKVSSLPLAFAALAETGGHRRPWRAPKRMGNPHHFRVQISTLRTPMQTGYGGARASAHQSKIVSDMTKTLVQHLHSSDLVTLWPQSILRVVDVCIGRRWAAAHCGRLASNESTRTVERQKRSLHIVSFTPRIPKLDTAVLDYFHRVASRQLHIILDSSQRATGSCPPGFRRSRVLDLARQHRFLPTRRKSLFPQD